ncbi:MAG: hypothetical protein NTZ12_03670, partial [Candidatus Aminicenantes bacterium]|nr:hypothetical protein [Candidatus Aminicenantes bacterium]
GRLVDVTFSGTGRAITVDELDSSLAEIPGLEGWQLDLPRPGELKLRILAGIDGTAGLRRHCLERLRNLYGGDGKIEIVVARALRHERSGKIRFTRTAFPVDHASL